MGKELQGHNKHLDSTDEEIEVISIGLNLINNLARKCSKHCNKVREHSDNIRQKATDDIIKEGGKGFFYYELNTFFRVVESLKVKMGSEFSEVEDEHISELKAILIKYAKLYEQRDHM